MQLLNLIAHLELSSLRKGADGGYKVPRGAMFRVVACPNYTAEILGWVLFSVATQAVPAAVFTLLGGVTMGSWAMQKYKRLRREFGKDYPKRSILFPFVF